MKLTNQQRVFLLKEFPFLESRNVWTGEPCPDCEYLVFEGAIPKGWYRLFLLYCKYLKPHLVVHNMLHKFMFTDIKEKYGAMRLYNFREPDSTQLLTTVFEQYSKHLCFNCGKISNYSIDNIPICDNCLEKINIQGTKQLVSKNMNMYILTCDKDAKLQRINLSLRAIHKEYKTLLNLSDEDYIKYIIKY